MFAPRGWLQGRGNRAMYRTIESSGLFDRSFYRQQGLTVVEKLSDPIWHYLRVGATRGLNPSSSFNTRFYRDWNCDVEEAGVNPFDHYLSYGQEEGRPPVKPLAAWHPAPTEALEPIKFYDSVRASKSRVSLILDSNTPARWPGDTELLLLASAWVAKGLGRELRVLRRQGGPDLPELDLTRLRWPDGVARPSVTGVPGGIHYSDIEKSDDEVFLASSWSSARVLFQQLGGQRLGYLVLEDEAQLLPAGEARRLASEALTFDHVTYMSTPGMAKHLALGNTAGGRALATESALNYGSYLLATPAMAGGSILVWAGDDLSASHTRRALESLERASQSGLVDLDATPVTVAGALDEPLLLLGTHQVQQITAPTAGDVVDLLSQASLVIALGGLGSENPVGQLATELGIASVTGLSDDLSLDEVVSRLGRAVTASPAASVLPFSSVVQTDLEKFAVRCQASWM